MRKRNRSGSASNLSACAPSPDPSPPEPIPGVFNDPSASDLTLRLSLAALSDNDGDGRTDENNPPPFLDLHVSSASLLHSRYFETLLSDRWQQSRPDKPPPQIALTVNNPTGTCLSRPPFDAHVSVIRLLHTLDFASSVRSPADALELLPVALQLLFDDLIGFCLRFLDSVPWTEEEEKQILTLIPMLQVHESRDLLSRIFPTRSDGSKSPSEGMLHDLINSAIHTHPNSATVKTFVAKMLRDYPSLDSVQKVLDTSFSQTLEAVKDLMGKHASPDFRVAGDNDEREAMQRLHLHAAGTNIKHLYWIIERMVEMRVSGNAVREWSEQGILALDLQKTLKDENYRNIAPSLPAFVTRCTSRLAEPIVSGHTLAPQQVRMNLVRVWLPVLNTCRELVALPGGPQRAILHELEETFLRLISTLPISDAQELLQQCLCFSTRNVEDCPHLVSAFRTWFRRADRAPHGGHC